MINRNRFRSFTIVCSRSRPFVTVFIVHDRWEFLQVKAAESTTRIPVVSTKFPVRHGVTKRFAFLFKRTRAIYFPEI